MTTKQAGQQSSLVCNERGKEAAETDRKMNEFVTAIQVDRFPDKVPSHNRFHCLLTVVDGVSMYGRRRIIPRTLRQQAAGHS